MAFIMDHGPFILENTTTNRVTKRDEREPYRFGCDGVAHGDEATSNEEGASR